MWVRGSRLRVPAGKLDAAIKQFKEETAPRLKSLPGHAGSVLLVERQQSVCLALTYWNDRAALDASETQATGLRAGVAEAVGATIEDVQRLEVLVMERAGTPHAGPYVRAVRFGLDPQRIDDAAAYFRDTVVPQIRKQDGFLAAICAVDRQQGRGIISTVWETQANEQATRTGLDQVRKDALARFGATQPEIETMQSAFVEFAATAVSGS
ncbi:MAG TPA: antibiotic biosynthesis monooxygenase [Candidatus Dormibacteraeota bacterium]|jgi:heme-degrading monooxygenase HmoA|nr:antibiotic biosynthesis monooxygenase [Candidatus Dormibacteraeota bacterium]